MFWNTGGKIKTIARVGLKICIILSVLGSIIGVLGSIELAENSEAAVWLALAFVLAGALTILICWIASLFVYGYGQLIEQSEQQTDLLCRMAENGDRLMQGKPVFCDSNGEPQTAKFDINRVPAWKRVEMERQNQSQQ